MPRGGTLMAGLLAGKKLNATNIQTRPLTHLEAFNLSSVLHADGHDFFYSSTISVLDALAGLNDGFFTWPTVSLYYSVFYSLRSILSFSDYCIWYVDHTPYQVRAEPGNASQKRSGNTHTAVLDCFREAFPKHPLLSQQIGLDDPLEWVKQRRDDANYLRQRFNEPAETPLFRFVAVEGVRNLISEYLSREGLRYAFDPDHAMLALPLHALKAAAMTIKAHGGAIWSTDEATFARNKSRDSRASYPKLLDCLHECMRSA